MVLFCYKQKDGGIDYERCINEKRNNKYHLRNSGPKHFTSGSIIVTDAEVRTDYVEMFNSKRRRGKTYFSIMHEMGGGRYVR